MASKVIRNITKVFRSASGVLFGRSTAGTGRGEELTPSQVRSLLSVYTVTQTDAAISTAVNTLIGGSPGLLDTLDELAAALGDDANFATTVTNALAGKVDSSSLSESIDDRVAALLVAGTNITLTYNDASNTLTIASTGSSGIGGSTGATDNRVLRSDGTGAATAQNSPVTIDDSGNVTGIGTLNVGGRSITSVGTVGIRIDGDSGTGTTPFEVRSGTTSLLQVGFSGTVSLPGVGYTLALGSGIFNITTAATNRSCLKSYVNLELCPGSLGGGGTYVEINNGTAGTYRDLKLRDMTASGMICAGTYTVGTLPSAAANAYKFATVSDSSVTTFGSTVAGGGSSKVQVYSNGTNWTVCAA